MNDGAPDSGWTKFWVVANTVATVVGALVGLTALLVLVYLELLK